jgi:hypothetical protein
MNHRLLPLALCSLALGAAACSSTSSSSTSTTMHPTTTTTRPTTTTTVKPTPTTAAMTQCRSATLAISVGESSGAAGHTMVPVVFKNTGSASCTLFGFPGVAALDSAGHQAAQATRTSTPSPTRVTLPAGASASALVTATSVPSGTATSCPTWVGLLVTPPNDTQSSKLSVQLPGCPGFTVGPVVAGTTGIAGS